MNEAWKIGGGGGGGGMNSTIGHDGIILHSEKNSGGDGEIIWPNGAVTLGKGAVAIFYSKRMISPAPIMTPGGGAIDLEEVSVLSAIDISRKFLKETMEKTRRLIPE